MEGQSTINNLTFLSLVSLFCSFFGSLRRLFLGSWSFKFLNPLGRVCSAVCKTWEEPKEFALFLGRRYDFVTEHLHRLHRF